MHVFHTPSSGFKDSQTTFEVDRDGCENKRTVELEDLETDGKRRGEFVGLVYTTGKCATGNWVREGVETNERTDGKDETRADVESLSLIHI